MSLDKLLTTVSKTKDRAIQNDTTRSISGASLVSGVISSVSAGGLDTQTIRISGSGDQGYQTGSNQSNRGQIPPSTLNKVPRIYGSCVTGGVVVDAYKQDANTLFYAFAISEMDKDRWDFFNQTSTDYDPSFTINNILRDNSVCTFSATSGNEDQVITLTDINDPSRTINTSGANVRVWAWAGSTSAADQIFPNNGSNTGLYNVNAYDVFPTWDSTITMEGLVFAIVQMDFITDDLEEFGSWSFGVTSKGYEDQSEPSSTYRRLTNPGWALQDYLTSDRYGLGLANADIDINSLETWAEYCDASEYYASDVVGVGGSSAAFPGGGSGYVNPHTRFRIDGFLNTQDSVVDNINRICDAGMATFNYDHKQGKFKVLFSKEMDSTDVANSFHFTSENIISSIQLSTTDIFSLYDFAETTFPNYLQLDAPDTIIVQVPEEQRFTNEITATTSFNLETVSDRPRAARIATTSLKLSRVGTIVQLTADHSSLVVDVGDFVRVTDDLKGWDEKYFRVMRITESENMGSLTCKFTLQEYTNAPFESIIFYDTLDEAFATGFGTKLNWDDPDVGILTFTNKYTSFDPVIQRPTIYDGLYVFDNPVTDVGRSINTDTGAITDASVPTSSAPISIQNSPDLENEAWLLVRTGLNVAGDEPEFSNVIITLENQTTGFSTDLFQDFAAQSLGTYTGFPMYKITDSGTYKLKVKYVRAVIDPDATSSLQGYMVPVEYSNVYTSANFTVNDASVTGNVMIDTYGENTQIVDGLANAQYPFLINDQFINMTGKTHDVIGASSGEWTYDIDFTQGYDATDFGGTEYLRVAPRITLLFANYNDIEKQEIIINCPGADYQYGQLVAFGQVIGAPNNSTGTFSMDPSVYGLNRDWYPSRLTVEMLVYANSLNNVAVYNIDYTISNQNTYYRNA